MALVKEADFFWIPLGNWFVEFVLDVAYFLMMICFLSGVALIVKFMTTYVSPVPSVAPLP